MLFESKVDSFKYARAFVITPRNHFDQYPAPEVTRAERQRKMKLYLEKRGCDFLSDAERQQSDLGNYRLFLEFIDKEGRRICGDVTRGDIRETRKNGKISVVSSNGLYTDFQYESHKGCFCYHAEIGCAGEYTKETVLGLVNSLSASAYDEIEIVDRLPEAAHEYPESVLELERAYLAGEHAAMVRETEQHICDNYICWYNGLQWSFSKMTPQEYKECTLLAFRLMADEHGIVSEKPEKLTPGAWVAHRMSKKLFEEQTFIDPYADESFLEELKKYSPYYVGRYCHEMTLDEFAAAYC